MGFIPEEQLSEIKSRLDIVALIGEHLPLKRAGQNWKGGCPFHAEKTASFIVSPEKQIYHCFGCGAGGNIFNFLVKFEGLSFPEAVEKCAERAGVRLQKRENVERVSPDAKKMLLRMNRFAASTFAKNLKDPVGGRRALEYLIQRGLKPETIERFELGYAPAGYDHLVSVLKARQIPLDLAEKVGLIRKREDGTYYDFFRDRLIFPIFSASGDVIGFGGRVLEDQEDQAKYINSSESEVYHKSDSLFGFHLAKTAIRREDRVILVEGYLDQISLFQAGIEATVAPLGTALTEAQVRQLSRTTKNFIVLFDGDAAGQKAAERSLPLFIKQGLSVKTVILPPEEDPDTLVQKEGSARFLERLNQAEPLLEVLIRKRIQGSDNSLQGKIEAARQVYPLLTGLSEGIEKNLYIQRLATYLHLEEAVLEKEIRLFSKNHATFTPPPADVGTLRPKSLQSLPFLEKSILQMVLSGGVVPASLFSKVDDSDFSDRSLQELWREMAVLARQGGTVPVASLVDRLEDEQLRLLAVSLAVDLPLEATERAQAFEDCANKILKRRRQRELRSLTQEMRLAEEKQDSKRVSELVVLKNKLMQEEN